MSENSYKNVNLPVEKRVSSLMGLMTLEEKIAQTISVDTGALDISEDDLQVFKETGKIQSDKLEEAFKHGIGSFQLPGKSLDVKESTEYRNLLQKYIKDNTRLQIPVLSQEECLNGQLSKGATMFPRPIGLAGTFDTELVQSVFRVIGSETRARGGHQAFTPVLDIGRDPRWGRIEETYGEDTYLVTQMGLAAVRGLQGGSDGVTPEGIIASPKHFVGYGQCAGGRNFAPTEIPLRKLRDEILPPFKAVVTEAKAKGIMPSHSEIDGIPCHGNPWLLTDILRGEWGFDGIVVSDYNDALRLDILHHVEEDKEGACVAALHAGLDMDIPIGSAYKSLYAAATKNKEVIKLIDRAVSRILTLKFQLGLFESLVVDPDAAKSLVNCDSHKALAKKAADKTMILLRNENEILPLDISETKSIAVIGPNADPVEFSYYSTRPNVGVSILEGIKAKVGEECEVRYEMGCHITKSTKVIETETETLAKNPGLYSMEEELPHINKAVEIAKSSDVAILCVGGSPSSSREAVTLQKHYGDNAHLDLVGVQTELIKRVVETGTPTIVIFISGKPITSSYVYNHVDAVIQGWYLGQETGCSVADVIFGDVNPGGKLPVTIPRSSGHLPAYYSQKPTGFLKDYIFEIEGPWYPFGYGLSYTTFKLDNLHLKVSEVPLGEPVEVRVDVTNTGYCLGDEVVQVYVRDEIASVTRPLKELKAFERVTLEAGESKTVTLVLKADAFTFTGVDYTPTIEKGTFTIMVGTSSVALEELKLELI